MKRQITTFALSAALTLAPFAALAGQPATQKNDLAPGPAAGVQQAQDIFGGGTATYVAGGILAAALIVVAVSGGGGHHGTTTSTSGTP